MMLMQEWASRTRPRSSLELPSFHLARARWLLPPHDTRFAVVKKNTMRWKAERLSLLSQCLDGRRSEMRIWPKKGKDFTSWYLAENGQCQNAHPSSLTPQAQECDVARKFIGLWRPHRPSKSLRYSPPFQPPPETPKFRCWVPLCICS